MNTKDKIEAQIRLYELHIDELRRMPMNERPITYTDQLASISRHIKKLKNDLEGVKNVQSTRP